MIPPLVSIIIPTYNSADNIKETIRSVVDQIYVKWELILVDDDSVDSTWSIIELFLDDPRIRCIKRDRLPKGGSVCRNIGIEAAKGEYVVFLDADDLLAPWCLTNRIELMMKYPGLQFGVFSMGRFTTDNRKVSYTKTNCLDPLANFISLICVWNITAPIWNTEFLRKIGGFKEDYQRLQDTELAFKALRMPGIKYMIFNDTQPDSYYRITLKKYDRAFFAKAYKAVEIYLKDVLLWIDGDEANRKYLSFLNRTIWTYLIYWWKSGEKLNIRELLFFGDNNTLFSRSDQFILRSAIRIQQLQIKNSGRLLSVITFLFRLKRNINFELIKRNN